RQRPGIAKWKPRPRHDRAVVERQGDVFVVRSSRVERLVAGTDLGDWEARAQLATYMERAGVQRALEKAGVKPGDTVRIGGKELEWV
ncbi:MAG: Obg family GTPase CgtA, partial [Dehalococcoidia bacterium]